MKYIVVESASDYNDEYYSVDSDFYSINSSLLNTIEEAKAILNEKVKQLFFNYQKEFKPSCFNFANYNFYDTPVELKDFISKFYDEQVSDWDLYLPDTATLEDCLEAYKLSGLDLYQIIKIEE